jgi:outer membrane protein W
MKKIGFIISLVLLVTYASAQFKFELGPQINGPMDKDFSAGAGIIVDAKYMVTDAIGVGLTAGYQHLFMADGWEARWYQEWGYSYSDANYNVLPIHATFTYYLNKNKLNPYFAIETGITKLYEEYTYYDSSYGDLTNESNDGHFAFCPQVGFEYPIGKFVSIDLNVKYNGFDLNYLSTKFGIVINL